MNVARIAALRAGMPIESSAMTINRYCASGLQAIALAAERIRGGGAEAIVAGGTESMSFIPFGGNKISINPWLQQNYPDSYLSMGLTAERVARHYGITREQADEFALASHTKALAAQAAGKFQQEIVPVPVTFSAPDAKSKIRKTEVEFQVDEGPRGDTSMEALGKLKAAFHAKGTVTAGNSSQTSDGAAAAVVMSEERARELGIAPMARFVAFAYAGCLPEEMGIGPVYAIPKALKLAGLTPGSDRPDRIERSVRRAVAGRDQDFGTGDGSGERQWRRDCVGASTGLHGGQTDRRAAAGNETAEGPVWDCDDVRGGRHGRRGNLREFELERK